MDSCPICLDMMDMLSFNDPRDHTETCFQLPCKHAYHTKCIIQALSIMNKKCPSCVPDKDASTELRRDGIIKRVLRDLKKEDEVKIIVKEVDEAIKENKEALKILNNEVKEFIERRRKELEIDKKRSYLLKCLSQLRRTISTAGKKNDPLFEAASSLTNTWRYGRTTQQERMFFGPTKAWLLSRLKFPYFRMSLY